MSDKAHAWGVKDLCLNTCHFQLNKKQSSSLEQILSETLKIYSQSDETILGRMDQHANSRNNELRGFLVFGLPAKW